MEPGTDRPRGLDDDGHLWVEMQPGRWVSWFDRRRYSPDMALSTAVLTEKWARIGGLRPYAPYRGAPPLPREERNPVQTTTPTTKTITTYEVPWRGSFADHDTVQVFPTRKHAETFIERLTSGGVGGLITGGITEQPHTYRVNQPVRVRAYGDWRRGWVTKIGRTRVTVNYIRNRSGKRAIRAFYPVEIRTEEKS